MWLISDYVVDCGCGQSLSVCLVASGKHPAAVTGYKPSGGVASGEDISRYVVSEWEGIGCGLTLLSYLLVPGTRIRLCSVPIPMCSSHKMKTAILVGQVLGALPARSHALLAPPLSSLMVALGLVVIVAVKVMRKEKNAER